MDLINLGILKLLSVGKEVWTERSEKLDSVDHSFLLRPQVDFTMLL